MDNLGQWLLTFTITTNPYVVFQAFIETHFFYPIRQKVKMFTKIR